MPVSGSLENEYAGRASVPTALLIPFIVVPDVKFHAPLIVSAPRLVRCAVDLCSRGGYYVSANAEVHKRLRIATRKARISAAPVEAKVLDVGWRYQVMQCPYLASNP